MKNRALFFVVFLLMYIIDIQAQKIKINHSGSLPGDWFYYDNQGSAIFIFGDEC